ncbi:MAG: hypothetical protein R3D44_06110 [Hyphomicrobiaceae bacterium]
MTITLAMSATLALGACANDAFLGLAPAQPTSALPAKQVKPAIDPACPALATRIEELRRGGVVDRAEAAAKGKGASVKVKRVSLAQLAELDKANAEFQAKCSTLSKAASAAPVKKAEAAPVTSEDKAEAVIAKAKAAATAKQ